LLGVLVDDHEFGRQTTNLHLFDPSREVAVALSVLVGVSLLLSVVAAVHLLLLVMWLAMVGLGTCAHRR